MIENYAEEIKAISEIDKIQDKLMIMAIYNEIFNRLKNATSGFYQDQYERNMREAFKETIVKVEGPKDFIEIYLDKMSKNSLSTRIKGVDDCLRFLRKSLIDYENEMDYAHIIDYYSIPFDVKVSSLVLFRDYMNQIAGRILENLGYSETNEDLVRDVIEEAIESLNICLASCVNHAIDSSYICPTLLEFLKTGTKVYLVNKYVDGEFNFDLIVSEPLRDYFYTSYKPMEQAMILVSMAYIISGYNNDDCDENRVKEICGVLGISKLRYRMLLSSITAKKAALENKKEKEEQKRIAKN